MGFLFCLRKGRLFSSTKNGQLVPAAPQKSSEIRWTTSYNLRYETLNCSHLHILLFESTALRCGMLCFALIRQISFSVKSKPERKNYIRCATLVATFFAGESIAEQTRITRTIE